MHKNSEILVEARPCEKYTVELVRKLIRIPSFTGKENEICEYTLGELRRIGLDTKKYPIENGRFNVVGRLAGNGNGPNLMLNGHLDTQAIVDNWKKDPLGGQLLEGRIYGVGSADQKAGVAAMISAAKAVIDSGAYLKGNLLVACVVGHMEGGVGTRGLMKASLRADYGVVTEPSEMSLLVEGGGVVYLEITTRGRSAFTPKRAEGVNAILKMMKVIEALERLRFDYRPTKYIKRPFLNVGVIKGGIWASMVPDSCTIIVDIRILPTQKPEEVKAAVEGVISRIRREDSEPIASVSYHPTVLNNPRYVWSVPENNRIVRSVSGSIKHVTGRRAKLRGFQGWADAGVLNKMGIPSIVYGPGDLDQVYAPDEHVEKTDLMTAAEVYALTILDVCGTDRKR